MKNQHRIVIDYIDEMRKQIKHQDNIMFWIYKLTMKMFSGFNNIPIKPIKLRDVESFEYSFAGCGIKFPLDTQFNTIYKLMKINYNVQDLSENPGRRGLT